MSIFFDIFSLSSLKPLQSQKPQNVFFDIFKHFLILNSVASSSCATGNHDVTEQVVR